MEQSLPVTLMRTKASPNVCQSPMEHTGNSDVALSARMNPGSWTPSCPSPATRPQVTQGQFCAPVCLGTRPSCFTEGAFDSLRACLSRIELHNFIPHSLPKGTVRPDINSNSHFRSLSSHRCGLVRHLSARQQNRSGGGCSQRCQHPTKI